ncbi:MAG: signal peptidase I [Treponema sp.]|nr:signal peptidase I [Treponema sp.]
MNRKLFEYSYKLKKEKQSRDLKIALAVILSILVISVVLNFLIFPVHQTSVSMTPDISNNSILFVTPLDKTPERGDVVLINPVFKEKLNWFEKVKNSFVVFFTGRQVNLYKNSEFPNTKEKLRRIVAVPGDTIYMKDYKLYIRPKNEKHFLTEFELSLKPYNIDITKAPVDWDVSIGISGQFDEITLGPNEYFVLCDNRYATDDSRLWGKINRTAIGGKALFCVFPFNKMKIMF